MAIITYTNGVFNCKLGVYFHLYQQNIIVLYSFFKY
jgi:hypothetical protein